MNKYVQMIALGLVSACVSSYDEEYKSAIDAGKAILITDSYTIPPSQHQSDGENYQEVTNLSSKTIKYLRYNFSYYNAVGDKIGSKVDSSLVGPVAPLESGSWSGWVGTGTTCIVVDRIAIEYMDGSVVTYNGAAKVQEIMRQGLRNSCRV